MGYNVHITRKHAWFDDVGEAITLEEWIEYVHATPEMRLDGYADVETPDGILRVESKGLSVWLSYSGHQVDGNMAWIDHEEGNIVVKNPDQEILKKMVQIARSLNAKVQGEECEVYDAEGNSIGEVLTGENDSMPASVPRKWWQFWRM